MALLRFLLLRGRCGWRPNPAAWARPRPRGPQVTGLGGRPGGRRGAARCSEAAVRGFILFIFSARHTGLPSVGVMYALHGLPPGRRRGWR